MGVLLLRDRDGVREEICLRVYLCHNCVYE